MILQMENEIQWAFEVKRHTALLLDVNSAMKVEQQLKRSLTKFDRLPLFHLIFENMMIDSLRKYFETITKKIIALVDFLKSFQFDH